MNNYPPGVTGREPQIAGFDDETDEYRECDGEVYNDETDESTPCVFAGKVSIGWSGRRGFWTCPVCDRDNADEADEPDYFDLWNED